LNASAGQLVGLLFALGGAATAVAARGPRLRYAALAVALAAAFALIVGEVWSTSRLATLRDHPPVAALALVAIAAVVGLLALAFRRYPAAFPVAAFVLLPLRIPVDVGGQTSSLLVPLYLAIAGGALALGWQTLVAHERGAAIRAGPVWASSEAAVWLRRLIAATLLLYLIQATYSIDVKNAAENTAFFYVPFAAMFVLLLEVRWTAELLRRLLVAVGAIALALAAIGIGEYATRHLLLNQDLRAENALHIYYRVNSLFRDPNIFGRYLALAIVALGGYLAWESRRRWALATAAASGVLLLALAFTFSLTSFAALLAGLVVIVWARFGTRRAAATVAAMALAGIAILIGRGISGTEVGSGGAGRTGLVHGGLELAADRPVWGWGSGAFGEAFYTKIEPAKTTASHDTPIAVAAEQGAIGLVVYVGLVLAALAVLFGGGIRGSPARATIAALFVVMIVHSLGYASFLEDPATWAVLALGLVLARDPPLPHR
jgi:putative inorganic carbon (HCO3(-)) transporter